MEPELSLGNDAFSYPPLNIFLENIPSDTLEEHNGKEGIDGSMVFFLRAVRSEN